ncbi:MAG: [protein-PII] uridylyltransferase, partial [Actinomycetota bacterium]
PPPLRDLCEERLGGTTNLALVAVGGYGRAEVSPHSDIDLLFVGAAGDRDLSKATLRNVLYPLWDAGFQVGHASLSPKQAIERATGDLHAATSLLTARLVWGAAELFDELVDRRNRWVRKERRAFARRVIETTNERHGIADRVGWTLAPDIKNGIGGLRDFHTVQWLQAITTADLVTDEIEESADILLGVREALHAEVPRKTDTLRLDLQQAVADRMGMPGHEGRDVLMEAVHTAGRRIEHLARLSMLAAGDSASQGPRRSGTSRPLSEDIRLEDGRIIAPIPGDVDRCLEIVAAVSVSGAPVGAALVNSMTEVFVSSAPEPWTGAALDAFVRTLKERHVEQALELLDHVQAWPVLMPEWRTVRGRAQHDPYHRYTVDAHSFRAVASIRTFCESDPTAAELIADLDHRRSLYIATLLHDIGKGSGEDHSIAGANLARSACARMGLAQTEIDEVETLVGHHLLLSDTATRRDIDDGAVIATVIRTIGDVDVLKMLYVLSGADGLATGPEAWTPWKASLVALLFRRSAVALRSGELPQRNDVTAKLKQLSQYDPVIASAAREVMDSLPPSYVATTAVEEIADDIRLLHRPPAPGAVATRIDRNPDGEQASVTICFADRPGTLARAAGVLALHRMSVLSARAYTTSDGIALERFVVTTPDDPDWTRLESDLGAVYSGRLALDARLARKANDYRPKAPISPNVRVLRDESEHSTVVEIRALDALGLLYALCSAITDLGLDIHVAKIDTLGERVVDVFYLRASDGTKLDPLQEKELEVAIRHRVASLFG